MDVMSKTCLVNRLADAGNDFNPCRGAMPKQCHQRCSLGKLDAGKPSDVTGQAADDTGFVWWKLADGGWVRSDVVQEAGDCESVPEATP